MLSNSQVSCGPELWLCPVAGVKSSKVTRMHTVGLLSVVVVGFCECEYLEVPENLLPSVPVYRGRGYCQIRVTIRSTTVRGFRSDIVLLDIHNVTRCRPTVKIKRDAL